MAVSFGRVTGRSGSLPPMFPTNGDAGGRSSMSVRVLASARSCGLSEQLKTLKLSPGATQKEVKKAYRRLALQFHPDVCKGDNCGVQFEKINEAYQSVLSCLGQGKKQQHYNYREDDNSYVDVMMDDEWEEWMGWEGANATRDYSNHINLYV